MRHLSGRLVVAGLALLAAGGVTAQTVDSAPRSFRVGGFADLELHTSSDNSREGIDLAEMDVYSIAELSESWSALGEGVAQKSWESSDVKEEGGIEFDLERLYVQYVRTDAFRIELGETHTGIVRWNEREHRSRFLQTPIDVPAIARRPQDDGAWPLRFIGAWASGRSSGPLAIAYGVGVGAGSGHTRDDIRIFGRDRSPSVLLSLSMAPDRIQGLEVAAAAYAQRLHAETEDYRERDVTLSLSYVNRGMEIRSEWARMNHRAVSTRRLYRTTGYYALLSRRLSGRLARLRPYLLVDRLNIANGDQYLRDSTPENAFATGARYDLTNRFSLKGEYRSQRAANGDREALLGLQIGLSF